MAVSIMAGIPALKDLNADLRRRMDQAVATFQASLASTRTGRASVHMLDQVKVDYYGTHTPISQLAQVSAPESLALSGEVHGAMLSRGQYWPPSQYEAWFVSTAHTAADLELTATALRCRWSPAVA